MTDTPLPPPDPAAPDPVWRPEDDEAEALAGEDVHDADRSAFPAELQFTTAQWEAIEAARTEQGLT